MADLGITYVDELPDAIAMVPLGREVFPAVMPCKHRLAPSRSITMTQIAREPTPAAAGISKLIRSVWSTDRD